MRLLANAGGIMGTQRREKKPPKWGTPPFVADYDDDEDDTPMPATRPRRVQTEPVPEVDPSQITMFNDRPRIVPGQPTPTMTEAERSPISTDAPVLRSRSIEGDMTALQEALQAEMDRPIENRKTKGWFGKLKRGFGKFARSMEQGGSLVGSIMNAADPTWDERQNKQNNINQMLAQYTTLNNVRKAEQDRQLQDEQIAAIPANRKLREIELEDIERDRVMRRQERASRDIFKSPIFDNKNPAHRKQAELAGLNPDDMPSWDRSKPNVQNINGVSYEKRDGVWTQIDAPSNKVRPFEVTYPDGRKEIYMIAESKAAQFAAAAAKMQWDAKYREDLADKRDANRMEQIEYTEAQKAQRIAIAAQIKAALEAVKAQPDNPEAKAKLEALRKQAAALQ